MHYFLIYKPFGMLSQFSREGDRPTLADLPFEFPKDAYPVGRLDADSEGLLLLTNDNFLNHHLLNPRFRHQRTYYVQVEGHITPEACARLRAGLAISIDGKPHQTLPADVAILTEEPTLPARNPPIRFRKNVPTSWVSISLHEGKNRQVRRMTAAVGFPTLRLARWAMEKVQIIGFQSGEVREVARDWIYEQLKITPTRSF